MVKLVSEQKIIDFRVFYAPQVYNIEPEAVLDHEVSKSNRFESAYLLNLDTFDG